MQTYTQAFAAGDKARFQGGQFFQLMEAPLGCDLLFFGPGGTAQSTAKGIKAGYIRRAKFNGVEITSNGSQSITLAISEGDGEYNRGVVTIDAVSVTWPRYGYRLAAAGVSGGKPACQFKNPKDSGKNLFIDRLYIYTQGTAAGDGITCYRVEPSDANELDGSGVALAGTKYVLFDTDSINVAGNDRVGVGHFQADSSWNAFSAPLPSIADDEEYIHPITLDANLTWERDYRQRPLMLRPEESLMFYLAIGDANLQVMIECEERDA